MKTIFIAIILFSSTYLLAQENMQPLAIGSPIVYGDKKMKAVNGKEVAIKDQVKKNGVLVMFSCNTCPVVKTYQRRTTLVLQESKKNNIGVIIINSNEGNRSTDESYNAMQQYAKAQQYKDVPYVVDENAAVADAFGARRTPESFLFNAEGKLVYHGAIDDNQDATFAKRNHLTEALAEVAGGKSVSVKTTRSVGCSIKRKSGSL